MYTWPKYEDSNSLITKDIVINHCFSVDFLLKIMVKCPLCNPLYYYYCLLFLLLWCEGKKFRHFSLNLLLLLLLIDNLMLTTNDCTILKFTDIIFYLLLFESTDIDGCKPKILTNFLDFFEICTLKHLN